MHVISLTDSEAHMLRTLLNRPINMREDIASTVINELDKVQRFLGVRRELVTVPVTLVRYHASTLAHWASVARTLNEARRLIVNAGSIPDADDDELISHVDDCEACLNELDDLIPALDHLHSATRRQLWEVERADGEPEPLA